MTDFSFDNLVTYAQRFADKISADLMEVINV